MTANVGGRPVRPNLPRSVLGVLLDVPEQWADDVLAVFTDAGRLAQRHDDEADRLAVVAAWLAFTVVMAERQGRDELAGWLSLAANAGVIEAGLAAVAVLDPPATPFL